MLAIAVALLLGTPGAASARQQPSGELLRSAGIITGDEIPVVPPGLFFAAGQVVPDAEVVPVGRLVEVVSPTVVPMRVPPQIQPYDRVNMVMTASVTPGDRLHLLRAGRLVPPYGRMYVATGTARVLAVQSGTATIEVVQLFDRVAPGDIAVPMPQPVLRPGVLPVPWTGLEGAILTTADPQPVVSFDEVYVNLGAASGVSEGDEFIAYLPAEQMEWGFRPEVEVGRLQIVRVTRLTSAARIVSLDHPAMTPGIAVRLVAKMP